MLRNSQILREMGPPKDREKMLATELINIAPATEPQGQNGSRLWVLRCYFTTYKQVMKGYVNYMKCWMCSADNWFLSKSLVHSFQIFSDKEFICNILRITSDIGCTLWNCLITDQSKSLLWYHFMQWITFYFRSVLH